MPNKTIYVKDEDLPLFEKLQADSNASISSRFAEFLVYEASMRNYIPKIEVMPPMATLRDQFAMASITGILANYSKVEADEVAKEAYQIADAMLETRK